jgi:tetratricopeptide (TPR) repeat protein
MKIAIHLTVILILSSSMVSAQDNGSFDDFPEGASADEPVNTASPFDSDARGVGRPVLTISKEETERLARALKANSEELMVDAASRILAKDPDHLEALNALAVHYFRQKKYGMAKILVNRALQKNPNQAALHNNMALIQLAEGDVRLALASFRESLKSGNYQTGALNLSSLLLKHRDFEKALRPLEEAYSKVRSDLRRGQGPAVDISNNYAVALLGTGESKKAKSVFEAIIEGGSRDPEVHLNYAILLVDVLKDKKDAQRVLSKLQFMTEDRGILRQVQELERRAQ